MSDRKLTVSFVAAVDASSFSAAQGTIVRQAKKANDQMAADAAKAAKEADAAFKRGFKARMRDLDQIERAEDKAAKTKVKSAEQASKAAQKASDAELATVKRNEAAKEREYEKLQRKISTWSRQAEAEARRAAQAEKAAGPSGKRTMGDRIMTGVGTRIVSSMISAPGRLAGDLLRGAGVDTSVGGQLGSSVAREQLANKIANAGWIESGRGPEGSSTRADPKQLLAESYSIGDKTGFTSEQVLGGMDKFVGMTGDLKTARSSMEMFGKIAKANSMDLNEMMDSVARLSMAMGDVPDKGEAIVATFRTMAGQGHIGSVMMDELGANMGKLATRAGSFTIDKKSAETLNSVGVTNSIGQRTAVMGALMQMASKGGRIGATQASNSATALIDDMRRGTMGKRLAEIGMTSFADASKTSEADPMDVIMNVLAKSRTKGGVDLAKVAKAFPNKQAAALGNEAGLEYNNFYKEAAARGIAEESERQKYAMEKLSDEFQNFLRVTQSAEGVTARFNAMMETSTGQANSLNNELGKTADELKTTLLPAVLDLAHGALDVAKFLSELSGAKGDKTKDATTQDAESRALNARSTLRRDLEKGGGVSDTDTVEGASAIKALEKAYGERAAETERLGGVGYGNLAADAATQSPDRKYIGFTNTPATVLDDKIEKGDAEAIKYKASADMRDRMRETLESLKADQETAMSRALRASPLEVRIVNLPTATVLPNYDGTMPGDSHHTPASK